MERGPAGGVRKGDEEEGGFFFLSDFSSLLIFYFKSLSDIVKKFASLSLSAILQECKVFDDSNFVRKHPKRCCQLLIKLLYLLNRGERLREQETSSIFFRVTKLFQSADVRGVGDSG